MSELSAPPSSRLPVASFTPFEYLTIDAGRDLASLYRDTYSAFGWKVEATPWQASGGPGPASVTLKLKRDRRIRSRQLVTELQHKAEAALKEICDLERSRTAAAMAAALGVGLIGTALLAGSVFAIEAGMWLLSVPLGALGLLGWLAGWWCHGQMLERRTTTIEPLIDHQFEVLHDACEQAARLLG